MSASGSLREELSLGLPESGRGCLRTVGGWPLMSEGWDRVAVPWWLEQGGVEGQSCGWGPSQSPGRGND